MKKWIKPELKIISRGESEENVLSTCKNLPASIVNGPMHHGCMSPCNEPTCKMVNCS